MCADRIKHENEGEWRILIHGTNGEKSSLDFSFEFYYSAMDEVSRDCSMCTVGLVTYLEINFLVLKHLQQFADKLPSLKVLKDEMV